MNLDELRKREVFRQLDNQVDLASKKLAEAEEHFGSFETLCSARNAAMRSMDVAWGRLNSLKEISKIIKEIYE